MLAVLVSIANMTNISSKILVTSIPKTGTTMLSKLTKRLTGSVPHGSSSVLTKEDVDDLQQDNFLLSHAPALEENLKLISENKFRTLVLLRDPRDVVVSMYYYFGPKHAKKLGLDHEADKDKIIMLYITKWYLATAPKAPCGPYIKGDYQQFLDWKKLLPDVLFTTYEALVGSKGGGNDDIQKKEIRTIADFLGVTLTEEELTTVACKLYGGTATFRNGSIGSWRNHFTSEHVRAFKEYTADLLIELGYEKDNDWGVEL